MLTENQVLKARDHFVGEVIRSGGDDGVTADALRWLTGAAMVLEKKREARAREAIEACGMTVCASEGGDVLDRLCAMSDDELAAHLLASGRL